MPIQVLNPYGIDWDPRLICGSLSPPESSNQTASRLVQPFLHTSPQSVPFPSIIAPYHWGSGPHLMCGFLGQPESSTQTASRSVEPFLQRTHYCDRPTDNATRLVTVGHIYVHGAMRPNKFNKHLLRELSFDHSCSIRTNRFLPRDAAMLARCWES